MQLSDWTISTLGTTLTRSHNTALRIMLNKTTTELPHFSYYLFRHLLPCLAFAHCLTCPPTQLT